MNARDWIAALASVVLTAHAGAAVAGPAEDKGRSIVVEQDRRDVGWQDSKVDLAMTLHNKSGETSRRELRTSALEKPDGDWTLIIFDEPKDVRGTALLTYSHKTDADEQWLYMPALKRVKRIASNNKSGPFMGSEFAYEDLSSQEVEKYSGYKWLRDEPCGELGCFVIERRPVDPNSGYTRQIVWIDRIDFRVQKVEFYDRKQSLLKTLSVTGYQRHLGKHWRPGEMNMVNHQTGKGTQLLFKDYRFGNAFSERDFDQGSLAVR